MVLPPWAVALSTFPGRKPGSGTSHLEEAPLLSLLPTLLWVPGLFHVGGCHPSRGG